MTKERLPFKALLLLCLLPTLVAIGLIFNFYSISEKDFSLKGNALSDKLDVAVSESIPLSQLLRQSGVGLLYNTGENLQDGIFITPHGLIKDFQPQTDIYRQQNNRAVINFSQSLYYKETAVYVAIAPSASLVLKQDLPVFSVTQNQQKIIENTYNQLASNVNTINIYNTLLNNRDKYIYFRTEDSITPLGGYYIYKELVQRMLVASEVIPVNHFGVSYSNNTYYGNLYQQKPFSKVSGDVLSFYNYNDNTKFDILHRHKQGSSNYSSFYSKNNNGLAPYRYKTQGIFDIKSNNNSDLKLLIIGDDQTIFWLPFISNHYGKVTFANINNLDSLSGFLQVDSYDQILITTTIETYTQSDSLAIILDSLITE